MTILATLGVLLAIVAIIYWTSKIYMLSLRTTS